MKAEAILIHRPERQHPARRTLFTIATLMAWFVWVSLWLPLATLIAWALGFHAGYVELVVRERGHGGHDMAAMLALAAACALVMLIWSSYNYLRYGHLDRRSRHRSVPRMDMARALGVQAPTATWMREAPRVVLEFLDDGRIVHREETQALAC